MKIRNFIFLIVIGLGLLPLVVLVALNLPKTIERFEHAAELETQALSHVRFTRLNARVLCLKKSLIRSASLPSTFAAVKSVRKNDMLASVFVRWFSEDEQVQGIVLFNAQQQERMNIDRKNGSFVQRVQQPLRSFDAVFQQTVQLGENRVFVQLVDETSDPFGTTGKNNYTLLMCTPIVNPDQLVAGIIVMRIDMSEFLSDFKDSFWVTDQGAYLRKCNSAGSKEIQNLEEQGDDCNAFSDFPGLLIKDSGGEPLILHDRDNDNKIAWMPLVFNREHDLILWIGTTVDESAIEQWKISLLMNVVIIVCSMAVIVFLTASWVQKKIDLFQEDLLNKLDLLISREKKTSFSWRGPREIVNLAADLTALADRYIDTCHARTVAESALRESEDKFRSLTTSALDGIILMDHTGNVFYWNEAATRIFGFTDDEALGLPVHKLLEPRRQLEDQVDEMVEQVHGHSGLSHTVELIARKRGGEEIFIELSLSSTRINNKWHAIWIVRDISERKKAEERSRRQQQQLQHADKMISLGLLVSGVAHEINNPNSIAMLNVPILSRSWESIKPILDEYFDDNGDFAVAGIDYSVMRQQLPRICNELEESASRIKEIVVDLKDYARLESTGHMAEVDINDIVQSGVRLTASSIHKATNSFEKGYGENLPKVLGNRQRLIQVVINLIQNSCDSLTDPNSRIYVITRYNSEVDGVEVVVQDQGGGIAADVLNKVTDPFFTTKRNIGGTGLGLSVSAGIIKEHHGVIHFDSQVGKGTEVIVSFPALLAAD